MLETSKPRLAIYAALAIAVLLIGARYLRSSGSGDAGGSGGDVAAVSTGASGSSSLGAPDGASGGVGTDGTMSDDGAGGLDGAGAGSDGGSGADGATGAGASGVAGADGAPSADGTAAEDADAVVVDVKGAVHRPGVYRLPPGARALDAVHRAGGMTHKADRIGVNLAARVSDGGEVIVPAKGHGGAAVTAGVTGGGAGAAGDASDASSSGGTATTPLSIDLNTASEQELEQLDGVGPATAQKIVEYREQHGGIGSVDELDAVSGIGERKLAAIEAQLGQ